MNDFDWQKVYRQGIVDKDGSFSPMMVSASALCEVYGLNGTGTQAERQIMREMKDCPEAAEHIFDSDKGLMIDDTGIYLFSHVFQGYISQDKLIEIWHWLKDVNKARRGHYELLKGIEGMSGKELKELSRQLPTVEDPEVRTLLRQAMWKARKRKLIGMLSR